MSRDVVKLLCFQLGEQVFAVDIMGIREILRNFKITQVPEAPSHVAGMTNLRGRILPAIDLGRLMLMAQHPDPPGDSKLLVVEVSGQMLGVLVDQVLDVASIPVDELSPVPVPSRNALTVAAFRGDSEGGGSTLILLLRLRSLLEAAGLPASGGPPCD